MLMRGSCLTPLKESAGFSSAQMSWMLHGRLEEKRIAPELYPYGSRGPVGAHYLAAKYNVRWGDLSAEHYKA
jgi:hypothetical protein